MENLARKFADETSLHGVKDIFYAKSYATKVFWFLVLIVGTGVTAYQMKYVLDTFMKNPVRTEVSLLPPDTEPVYPPFSLMFIYYTDWVDLRKVKRFDFDLESFFYLMSYFYPIHTRFPLNIKTAEENLKKIMTRLNIFDPYDLAMEISPDRPLRFSKNVSANYSRFIESDNFYYTVDIDSIDTSTTYDITMSTSKDFEHSKFYADFLDLFNYSLIEDHKYFTMVRFPDYVPDDGEINILVPFYLNVLGKVGSFNTMDMFSNEYDYYIYGTVYNWLPTNNNFMCDIENDAKFYVECQALCANQYKPYPKQSCNIFLLSDEQSVTNADSLNITCRNNSILFNIDRNASVDQYFACINLCSSSCTQWKYYFQVSVHIRTDLLTHNVTMGRGKIWLTYAKKDSILQIALVPALNWVDAIASLGGLLGLWLGGSIISFVQIFYTFGCLPLEAWFIARRTGKGLKEFMAKSQNGDEILAKDAVRDGKGRGSRDIGKANRGSQQWQNAHRHLREQQHVENGNRSVQQWQHVLRKLHEQPTVQIEVASIDRVPMSLAYVEIENLKIDMERAKHEIRKIKRALL